MINMRVFKTISGRTIKVTSNKRLRHYTIKTESGKYRTFKLDKDSFNSCRHNTGNDWQAYLNSNDYYKV